MGLQIWSFSGVLYGVHLCYTACLACIDSVKMKTPECSRTSRVPKFFSPFAPKSFFCYGLRHTHSRESAHRQTHTHTHGHTDRTDSITSTADMGGKMKRIDQTLPVHSNLQ